MCWWMSFRYAGRVGGWGRGRHVLVDEFQARRKGVVGGGRGRHVLVKEVQIRFRLGMAVGGGKGQKYAGGLASGMC